jgi:PAS domain S-box-containing protein
MKIAADAREMRIIRQRVALAKLSIENSIISGDIQSAKKVIAEIAADAMQTERISIWLFSDDESELNCIELYEAESKIHSEGSKLITSDYQRYFSAIRKDSRINSPDVYSDSRLTELKDNYFIPLKIRSLIDAGIFIEGRLAGVLSFEQVGHRREWFADEESFVSTISTLISQVLINAERTMARKALEESLAQNQALIDSIPDLVFLFSREGIFLNIHAPSFDSLFVKPEEFLNRNINEVLPGYLARLTHKNLQLLFKTGQPRYYEYEMDHKGTVRYFDSRMVLCGRDKAMTIVRDITEQKRIQKELLIAKEKAEESDRLKSAFLANMSHEIRTPMNSIVGFASLLKGKIPDEERKEKYLEIITSNADHLLRLINDIIDISKIESGDIDLHLETVDIQKLFEELLKMFFDRKPGVEIRFLTVSVPNILCDRVKLSQVLTNLLGNAIKFTNQGYVEYSVKLEGNSLVFRVEDTGSGVLEEMKELIFDRFAQGDNSASMSRGGTGLGLAIAKAYVEKMGGTIWVDSLPGKGSTFYFSIPYLPAGKHKTTKLKQEELIGRSMNILVAEDDILNYLFLEEIFSDLDVNIKHAANGKEAVELFKSEKFDLVLMDIKMPVMGGLEATRKIKSINPKIPVIAVSAHAFWSEQEKAFQAGCDDYITKPLRPEELKKKVNDRIKLSDE